MSIVLGPNRYGKAETRLVRIVRDTARHEITDLNVSSALRGDFDAAYLEGDQRTVLPTDTQKNSAYVWAKKVHPDPIETYGLALAHHFVDDVVPVEAARIEIERFDWTRVDGRRRPARPHLRPDRPGGADRRDHRRARRRARRAGLHRTSSC